MFAKFLPEIDRDLQTECIKKAAYLIDRGYLDPTNEENTLEKVAERMYVAAMQERRRKEKEAREAANGIQP